MYSCVIQSSLALSSLSFLFSWTPYDIPLLDLLALCQCPCAPFFHLFPTSSVSPEGAFRLVKWSPACYGSPHSSPFSFIPLCSSQFLVSSVFASSFFFLGSFLIHFHILSPTRTHRNTHTLVHFYSLSLLSGSSSCHQSDKCQQSPHCLIWPSILPPSPLSPSLSILEQPSVSWRERWGGGVFIMCTHHNFFYLYTHLFPLFLPIILFVLMYCLCSDTSSLISWTFCHSLSPFPPLFFPPAIRSLHGNLALPALTMDTDAFNVEQWDRSESLASPLHCIPMHSPPSAERSLSYAAT